MSSPTQSSESSGVQTAQYDTTAVVLEEAAANVSTNEAVAEVREDRGDEADSQRTADALQKALNKISGSQIRFGVNVEKGGRGDVSFQIVERETGEVVKQFPPEAARAIQKTAAFLNGPGTLVDQSA